MRQKRYLFGAFTGVFNERHRLVHLRVRPGRLALVLAIAGVAAYAIATPAFYGWLRYKRDVTELRWWHVATFQLHEVRHAIGLSHFSKARAALRERDWSRAFSLAQSGLRQAPADREGRMMAADLWIAAGATDRAIAVLKSGLRYVDADGDPAFVDRLLTLLVTTGRDAEALELLRGPLASHYRGPRAIALRAFELMATLDTEGSEAARALLEAHPGLRRAEEVQPVVARVLWESGDDEAAIACLQAFVRAHPERLPAHTQLIDYLQKRQRHHHARAAALAAQAALPENPAVDLLVIATQARQFGGDPRRWNSAVRAYLSQHGHTRSALLALSEMAGRFGWLDLSRFIYEGSLARQEDAYLHALYNCDALLRNGRSDEAWQHLATLQLQTPDAPHAQLPLWERQILAASALGRQSEAVAIAQQLSQSLRTTPGALKTYQKRFAALGLETVASELTDSRNPKPASPPPSQS